jgi:hypothetical protein
MENNTSNIRENNNAINPFIASTAKDYGISYAAVEVYYKIYGPTPILYDKLEEHLKQRSF